MDTKHKKFKPFDKVLVRDPEEVWQTDLYGFWDKCRDRHQTMMNSSIADEDILPYEGNEHLVGTTDEPEEEVKLEEGEWVMFTNGTTDKAFCYNLRQYCRIDDYNHFISKYFTNEGVWSFAVKFSDFNPNDMEETKKHILCVKNGKVVRYKN